jgi:hypothetical protein
MSRAFLKILQCLFFSFILVGCGFSPIHSEENSALKANLPYVDLEVVVGGIPLTATHIRVEQLFKQYFSQTVNPRAREGRSRYALKLTLSIQYTPLAIQQDSRVTRMNIGAAAEYTFSDMKTKKIISRKMRREGSFDATSASQYATFSAEQDAQERILRELAWDMAQEVAGLIKAKSK